MQLTDETIADHAMPLVHRALVVQARELIAQLTPNQKLEVVKLFIHQASKRLGTPSIQLLVPKVGFEEKFKKAWAIAEFLPVETLLDLALEILEQPTDQNG